MKEGAETIADYIVESLNQVDQVTVYFASQAFAIVGAYRALDLPGVLICRTLTEAELVIDIAALTGVKIADEHANAG